MAIDCSLASPGLLYTTHPTSPEPKKLAPSGRDVGAATRPVPGIPGAWEIEVRVAGVVVANLRDPRTQSPFNFIGQTQFMVMPAGETIVVRYVGSSTPTTMGDTVRLIVVDLASLTASPLPQYEIDLGPMPLMYDIHHLVNLNPSGDGALLFVYVQSWGLLNTTTGFKTQWHRIVCAKDGTVICEYNDQLLLGPMVQRWARVTAARTVDMMYTGDPPDGTVLRSCPLPSQVVPRSIEIVNVDFNPPGIDLPKELVRLRNFSNKAVTMTGWTLRDAVNHVFAFPADFIFQAGPGTDVLVWTKAGTNTSTDLFWGSTRPVWNNASSGDRAELRRPDGSLASAYSYSRPSGGMSSGSEGGGTQSGTGRREIILAEWDVRVDGRQALKLSPVQCRVGETFRISATGNIWTVFGSGGNGPEGWAQTTTDTGYPLNSTDESFIYSLIGRIGFGGPIRFVGSSKRWDVKAEDGPGQMFFGINDNGLGDNSGEFYVTVRKVGTTAANLPTYPTSPDVDQSFFLGNGATDLDTGIDIQRGDRIRIDTPDTDRYTPGGVLGGGATGPDGWDQTATRDPNFPLGSGDEARKFALLFKYANGQSYHFAGSSVSREYWGEQATRLLLRINDDTTGGEAGGFNPRVRIRHALP